MAQFFFKKNITLTGSKMGCTTVEYSGKDKMNLRKDFFVRQKFVS